MKRLLKIAVGLVAVMVVLALLSAIAVRLFLPPEKAKALVLKQLTAQLKREVRLEDVSVGALTGLKVSKLQISEAPDFSKGTFISSEHFTLRLALLPLLFRRIEVKELIFDQPVIRLIRQKDGRTYNFSDLLTDSPKAPPVTKISAVPRSWNPLAIPDAHAATLPGPTSTGASTFRLTVSDAQIEKGTIYFIDHSTAQRSMEISRLDLALHDVSTTAPFSIQASLQAKMPNVTAGLNFAGQMDLALGSVHIKTCELTSGGSSAQISGKTDGLKTDHPSIDLSVAAKEFRGATLSALGLLPAGLKVEGPINVSAQAKGDMAATDVAASVDLTRVLFAYGKQFLKPAGTSMKLDLRGRLSERRRMEISDVRVGLGTIRVSAHGKIAALNTPQPQMNLHLESNTFPVGELFGYAAASLPQGMTATGKAQISADVSGTQSSSSIAAKIDGKALAVKLTDLFHKPEGTALRLTLVGERVVRPGGKQAKASTTLNFPTLQAELGSINLTGHGSWESRGDAGTLQLIVRSNTFSLQDISRLVPMLAVYQLNGRALANLRASGSFQDPRINGSMELQQASLRYQQSDITNISTTMTFTEQDVVIPKLNGKLNGSDMALKLTGRRLKTHPDIQVDAQINELDLGKLLPPISERSARPWRLIPIAWAAAPPSASLPMKVAGTLVVGRVKHDFYDAKNLNFKWDLSEVTPDLSRVNGSAALRQGAGLLKDIDKLAQASKTARLALLPLVLLQRLEKNGLLGNLGLPSLKRIPFRSIQGDYLLRSGVAEIPRFELLGDDLDVHTTGTAALYGQQIVDLRVVMKAAAGAVRGSLGHIFSDEAGRATIPFTIKGPLANPVVKADLREAGRKAVKELGNVLRGLGVGKPAGQQMPGAPPAGEAPANEAAPSAPSGATRDEAPRDPLKEAEKALKNIFR